MTAAIWIERALFAYAVCGFLFAIAFLAAGLRKVDPGTAGSGWSFRLILLPGCALFWPLLWKRWAA